MGDRANVYLVMQSDYEHRDDYSADAGIYLYTHWDGTEWPERLRDALAFARERWGDESYCARIIISRMFRSLGDSLTGGGVALTLTSGEYPILVVDIERQRVALAREGDERDRELWAGMMSFDEYIELPCTWHVLKQHAQRQAATS